MSSSPNTIGDSSRRPNPSGKSYKIHKEIHPEVKPKWRREDAVASAAESFSKGESAVQKMEARQPEPEPAAVRPKGKAKTVIDTTKLVDEVSPKGPHRDQRIDSENTKFAQKDGIVQLIGEKDRASPPRHEGKTKIIRSDVHPDVPPRVGNDAARTTESDKFASDKDHNPLSRIGEKEDQANSAVRKKVVPGRKNHPNLITPEPAPHVIMRRTTHTSKVLSTYETAIAERETSRQAAADAQSNAGTLLQKFSPSEAVAYRPGVRQIPHSEPHGTLPADSAIVGFPGLGSKSGVTSSGKSHHVDPNNGSASRANAPSKGANHIVGSDGIDDLSASRQHFKQRYDKTMDSQGLAVCMSHPDKKPFDQKTKDSKAKKMENYDNEPPLWWPKGSANNNNNSSSSNSNNNNNNNNNSQHQHHHHHHHHKAEVAKKITNDNAKNNNDSEVIQPSSIGRGRNVKSNLPSTSDTTTLKPGRRVAPQAGVSYAPSWWPAETK